MFAQQRLAQFQMAAGRYRKEFGQALNDSQNNGIDEFQLVGFVFVRRPKDGIDLQAEASQHQGRSQSDAPEIEYFRVKDIGVVASPARHQYVPEGDETETYKHPEVVLASENKIARGFRIAGW